LLPDFSLHQELQLNEPTVPQTWFVLARDECHSLSNPQAAANFFQDAQKSCRLDRTFVSVQQDAAGCHKFVSLAEAQTALLSGIIGSRLKIMEEADVKALDGSVLLFARPRDDVAPESLGDLTPHSIYSNYSVVSECSLGHTQKLILCDEATLTRSIPQERIFEYLKLIVNCHEDNWKQGKYRIGSCSSAVHPRVICTALHKWNHRSLGNEQNELNDQIQVAIWEALQTGTVAVHCLAGIHRAACIVACHFLWRHYYLGHTHIPGDSPSIYCKLQAVRRHVTPAYEHVLESYLRHLRSKKAGVRS